MKFLQTFESYLKGGRAPLYHFTSKHKLDNILSDDVLKIHGPSKDKNGKGRGDDQIKSISLTRYSSLSGGSTQVRIALDVDKLIKDGYVPYPIDEIGASFGSRDKGWESPKSNMTRKFLTHRYRTIQHNIEKVRDIEGVVKMEYEYEERIYKNIENLGKYITYIDIDDTNIGNSIKDFIKKYPHITVRKLSRKKVLVGDYLNSVPKDGASDILYNIDMINKEKSNLVLSQDIIDNQTFLKEVEVGKS